MYKLNVAESLSFFFRWIKKLFWLGFIFVLLLCFFRLAAWIYFGDSQNLDGRFMEVLEALLLGARYDLSLFAVITFLPLVYLFWVTLKRSERSLENYGSVVRPYFLLIFLLTSLFLAMDLSFFAHLQEHIALPWIESLIGDPQAELERLVDKNSALFFVGVAVGGLIYTWLIFKISKSILKPFRLKQSFISKSALNYVPAFLISLVLLAIAAWGTIHEERLSPSEASFSRNSFVNYLAGNSLLFLAQDYRAPRVSSEHAQPQSSDVNSSEQKYEFLEFNPSMDQQKDQQ